MKKNKLTSNWIIWSALILSILALFKSSFAFIAIIFLIIALVRQIHIDKNYLPDINAISELKNRRFEIENLIAKTNLRYEKILKDIKIEEENYNKILKGRRKQLEKDLEEIQLEISKMNQYRDDLNDTLVEDLKKINYNLLFPYDFENVNSDTLKANLHKLDMEEKKLLGEKSKYTQRSINESLTTTYKNNQFRQITRLFNAETNIVINKVTSRNFESSLKRLFTIYNQLNKIFELDGVSLPQELLDLKLERLTLMKDYDIKLEDERIIRREERERIKEEKQAKQEMERKLKDLDKDIRHHTNEISKLTKYLHKSKLETEKELYIEKIRELEENIKKLDSDKHQVEDRIVKAQSGYVYVISNIGSFGENIYKIGVTRRLEPMDRIRELSSASVPFEFDVHALIFAEDAFELEDKLHKHFKNRQVNKVNSRKEFFNVNLSEIKDVVLREFNGTVNFIVEPEAEQYRETLRIIEKTNL